MANDEIVALLKEIRDLQKVQIANNQEAVKTSVLRMQSGQKRIAIFLVLFLFAICAIAYLPAVFSH